MDVRWSPEAADDLADIVAYIRKDDSAAAQRTAKNIYGCAGALSIFRIAAERAARKARGNCRCPRFRSSWVPGNCTCGRNRKHHPRRATLALIAIEAPIPLLPINYLMVAAVPSSHPLCDQCHDERIQAHPLAFRALHQARMEALRDTLTPLPAAPF
jgi:hypothetical protein